MDVEGLCALLGARVLDPGVIERGERCMTCWRPLGGVARGRVTECASCTCRALGTTPYALALAVEFGWSIKRTEEHLFRHGHPGVNPKAWSTPRSRLRR
jgi:hypothetical protein